MNQVTIVKCRSSVMKSVLLYGAPNTGKTSLCQSIAHAAGANFFDLSPHNTDAKYPGKTVALMVHMVSAIYACSMLMLPDSFRAGLAI